MKARSLGISFIAAVIVPSILLAVLSIRSAGREEAWRERQVTAALESEVTNAAGLADAEVGRVVDELRSGLEVPAGGDYGRLLDQWKSGTPLVGVPYLLSPRYGILWPPSGARADDEQKRFLRENGDFLGNRAATTVLQNIAVKYQGEILAESQPRQDRQDRAETGPAPGAASPASASVAAPSAAASPAAASGAAKARGEANAPAPLQKSAAPMRQMAIDTFAQNPGIQSKVYEEAREKGDRLNARIVSPEVQTAPPQSLAATASAASTAPTADAAVGSGVAVGSGPGAAAGAPAADTEASGAAGAPTSALASPATPSVNDASSLPAHSDAKKDSTAARRAASAPPAPSQFVVTSQLLSQIASQGDYGVIPRFVTNQAGGSSGDTLEFLFWSRQKDGRIAGCEIASAPFRSRIAGVLESTWTPVRVLTLLDENGTPLASPPNDPGRDWRRPFVAREIGERLPRWEAAAYLTRPDVITSQARTSSLVIWVLVMILFVSVAGGGTMVLSSVYAGIRVAQQKATFVTNVSHELKTPLTSISLFIDLLRRKGPLPAAKKDQYLSLMASETERLTRLINNVLDFSRDKGARRYAMRTVDASEVARQIVESQKVRLQSAGFSVTLDVEDAGSDRGARSHRGARETGCLVHADPEAVKQILLNLLSNAEKYSKDRREISVAVRRGPDAVTLTVADRGIGVPEHERERIFREFYRVDDSLASGVPGTGLGLSIARRIARDHGGEVACAPREGGGTEFVVRLPAVEEGA